MFPPLKTSYCALLILLLLTMGDWYEGKQNYRWGCGLHKHREMEPLAQSCNLFPLDWVPSLCQEAYSAGCHLTQITKQPSFDCPPPIFPQQPRLSLELPARAAPCLHSQLLISPHHLNFACSIHFHGYGGQKNIPVCNLHFK